MADVSFNGAKIGYKLGTDTTYTNMPKLKSIPAFASKPEKIDTTTLEDEVKTSINGIGDPGDVAFEFNYDIDLFISYLSTLDGNEADFQVEFSDGTLVDFKAIPTFGTSEGDVNKLVTFKMECSLRTKFTFSKKTA